MSRRTWTWDVCRAAVCIGLGAAVWLGPHDAWAQSGDTAAPAVTIDSPSCGSTVSGLLSVTAGASDDTAVAGVQFHLDGASLGAEDTTAPYEAPWDTTPGLNGSHHVLSAVARDTAGNVRMSPPVAVTIFNPDGTAPTISITTPAMGSTVSGVVTVAASAADNQAVSGVQFRLDDAPLGAEDTVPPYSLTWDSSSATDGLHTLTAVARDAAGNATTAAPVPVTVANAPSAPGDIFLSLQSGFVQWRRPDGTLRTTLPRLSDGPAPSLAFDAAGILYVPHGWSKSRTMPNHIVVRYDARGEVLGGFGAGHDCRPSSLAFDEAGSVYVGLADCTGDILKFDAAGAFVRAFDVAREVQGAEHIALAADGCTMLYASRGQNVLRYDVCADTQLPNFNREPLPGEAAFHLRILPDGGVLVADAHVLVRLDASGSQVQTYSAPGQPNYWGGVDLAGDGSFWATNAFNGNVYRFDLQTGAVLAGFNAGTGAWTVAGVAVRPAGGEPPPAPRPPTPPSVTLLSPAPGSTVTGTVDLSAEATDDVSVAGVQFRLDGVPLGAEDTTAPYAVTWDTTTTPSGSTRTVTAVARDGEGNTTTSSAATVTVTNGPPPDVTAPAVSLTAPSPGVSVSGTVAVTADASDDVAVAGVQFQLDGVPLGAEDTTAPYAVDWDTTAAANGPRTLRAVARDAAGNMQTSAAVTVTVSNGPAPDTTAPEALLSAPGAGATVSGTVTLLADASDNVGVAAVQFRLDGVPLGAEDDTAPYSVSWDTTAAADGPHTLTAVARDAANNVGTSAAVTVTVSNAPAPGRGDVFVALVDGHVQWRNPDGSLRTVLNSISDGQVSSLAFDAARNLYVPHWWGRSPGVPGNTMVRFDAAGGLLGTFAGGFNCSPSSMTFDTQGHVYVGQADCTGDILKFDSAGNLLASFDVAVGNQGTDHIDLAADGCTMFYASRTRDIFRFDVCTNSQLAHFNAQPLPGEAAFHLRLLPDGGLVVADAHVIVRLDAAGNQVRLYWVPGEPNYWGGLDVVGDGSFWATNAVTGNVYKFDLETGAVLNVFNTGTGPWTAAGVAVKP